MKLYLTAICTAIFFITSCKTTQHNGTKLPDSAYNLKLLFQTWDVDYIEASGRKISGTMMGNPQYRFSSAGKRYKSYKEPPHTDSTTFIIRNDSIHYTGEKDFPSVAIEELTDSSLLLMNDNAKWRLYRK